MKNLKKKLNRSGGFTLVEMLIVVAIIAILIAVSIPLVSDALEQARDNTDLANERAAKAEAAMAFMGVAKIDGINDFKGGAFGSDTNTENASGAAEVVYYDAPTGQLKKVEALPTAGNGYGQCTKQTGCAEKFTKTNSGMTSYGNSGGYIKVKVDESGEITLTWANVKTA